MYYAWSMFSLFYCYFLLLSLLPIITYYQRNLQMESAHLHPKGMHDIPPMCALVRASWCSCRALCQDLLLCSLHKNLIRKLPPDLVAALPQALTIQLWLRKMSSSAERSLDLAIAFQP